MDALLADDYMAITANGTLQSKEQTLANLRAAQRILRSIEISDRKVRFYGTTALVTSRAEVSGTNAGGDISGSYRYTRVYVRDAQGKWKIVSFEASRIREPGEPQVAGGGKQSPAPQDTFPYNGSMPELPEVETIARGVHERLRGDRIVEVWFGGHPRALQDAAGSPGQRAGRARDSGRSSHRKAHRLRTGLRRRTRRRTASQLLVKPEETPAAQWIVHLGMTGRLLVTTPDAPLASHTHARLTPGQRPGAALCGPAPLWAAGVPRSEPEPGFRAAGR